MHGTLGAKLPIKRKHSRSLLEALDLPGLHFLQLLQLFQTICDCDTCLASPEKIVQAATVGSFRKKPWKRDDNRKLLCRSDAQHVDIVLIHLRRPCHQVVMISIDFCVWDMIFEASTLSNLGTCNKSLQNLPVPQG